MTINEIIKTLETVKPRDRDRPCHIVWCFDGQSTEDDYIVDWADCSDAMLIFIDPKIKV